MKIIDSHLHVGKVLPDYYVNTIDVKEKLESFGVEPGFIMPIPIIGTNQDDEQEHELLYDEMFRANVGVPTLYLTPTSTLDFDRRFTAIKVHPYAKQWTDNDLMRVFDVANQRKVIVLIHTGYDDCCCAKRFGSYIKQFADVRFILCHGRPVEQIADIMRNFNNVWADTAFMPIADIVKLVESGFQDRILFGTDYPINRWFAQCGNEDDWYMGQIEAVKRNFTESVCAKLFHTNFEAII